MEEDYFLEKDERMKKYIENPILIAEEALKHMIFNNGLIQDDDEVQWEHLGLMPIKEKNGLTVMSD